MSTPAPPGRGARVVTVLAVLLVAAVAALVSYAHMREVADRAGEQWRAWLLPLAVDGLVVAASMVLLTRRRAGLPDGRLAWVALLGGVGASLAANIAAAQPDLTARVVASWPAIAFAVAFELLLQQRRVAAVEPVDALPVEVGVPVVESSPTSHPVGDSPVEPVEPVGEAPVEVAEPVGETDPLNAHLTELLRTARTEGRTLGRRTVARELGVTEYRAAALLANNNGTGGTR